MAALLLGAALTPLAGQARDQALAEGRQRLARYLTHSLGDELDAPPLADGAGAGVQAEIRVSIGGWWPDVTFRLVDSAGTIWGEKTVTWAEYAWKPEHLEGALAPSIEPDRCGPPRSHGQLLTCRIEWSTAPDWSRVWLQLAAAGVWHLPTPTLDAGADGWSVTVETRRGNAYQLEYYWLPDMQGEQVAHLAKEITHVLDTLPRRGS